MTSTGDTNKTRRALLDTAKAEQAMELKREEDAATRKKTTQTMADIILLLDELPKGEAQRVARAVGVYFEVYR